ncbi:EamA family transporter [Halobium salinum]|uniref:EamA family transporter n=1 Tax=Halobium salinum TaxID=1364940 RepID=A0ABD5PEV6_9EURY|nr:DMT family transporter [Halobium salinum]
MPLDPGIGYALLAALVWGVYIFALKRYFDDYPATPFTVLVNCAAVVVYLPVALTTVDPAEVPDPTTFAATDVGAVLLTVVGVGAAFVLFLRAIDAGAVSYVTPINKVVPVFVLPIEVALLGAHLRPIQVLGVVVATLAVYVANYEPGHLLDPIRRAATSRPAQLALLSAVAYAVSDVGKRVALGDLGIPTGVWVPFLLLAVALLLAPLAAREWPDWPVRRDLPRFLVAGALVATGEHVTSLAFSTVPASVASPIINTQAVVAVLLGGVLLGEEALGVRLAAAGLAVAGVTLVAL